MNCGKHFISDQGQPLIEVEDNIARKNDALVRNRTTEYQKKTVIIVGKWKNAEEFCSEDKEGDKVGYIRSIK